MNPFATLGVEPRFDLDLPALEKTHRELSRALHPDKYVGATASERRAALERAVAGPVERRKGPGLVRGTVQEMTKLDEFRPGEGDTDR